MQHELCVKDVNTLEARCNIEKKEECKRNIKKRERKLET